MDPLVNGDYPHTMRSIVGERLPKFTKIQSKTLKGSFNFIGINYYTSYYAAYAPKRNAVNASFLTDSLANLLRTNSKLKSYFYYGLVSNITQSILTKSLLFILFVVSAERNGIPIGPKVSTKFSISFSSKYCI